MEMKANREREPPLLLISHGKHNEKQSFYSVLENRFQTTIIPVLCNKQVLGSNYGWLVLVDKSTNDCCLWNPISTDIIELPTLRMSCIYNRCILSKPPTEPDCHILFNSASNTEQAFCQVGDEEYVVQSLIQDDNVQSLMAMGCFEGKIYGFIGHGYQLVTIHFVGKTLELRPILEGGQLWHIPIASPPWATWYRNYFIKSPCDSELLLVRKLQSSIYIEEYCDFRVYQVDINRKECMELESLGQRTIFVSHSGDGFCCSSSGTKPNSIYYTRTAREDRNLYIYNLDDKSTTMLLPCPAARRFESVCFWVEHEVLSKFIN